MTTEPEVSILFVDDEPHVLQGLRRSLRPMYRRWRMFFAESGPEALDLLEREACDVLVCDMCMPGMRGSEVLQRVRRRFPSMVRMVLSGQTDQDEVLKALGTAHVYLAKPSGADTIVSAVNKAMNLRAGLPHEDLHLIASSLEFLPFYTGVFENISRELSSPNPDLEQISRMISMDFGPALKMLQIVNSPFFGLPHRILDVPEAVSLLGPDRIKALIESYAACTSLGELHIAPDLSKKVRRNSLLLAGVARAIAQDHYGDQALDSAAYTAGLLHGAGILILAAHYPEKYEQVLTLSMEQNIPLERAEGEAFQASHSQVGAFLIGLWGLPDELVEAAAFHHKPQESRQDFALLSVLHAAEFLASQALEPKEVWGASEVDLDYLARVGLAENLPRWREMSAEICEKIEQDI